METVYDGDPRVNPYEADVMFEGQSGHAAGFTVTTEHGTFLVLDATGPVFSFGWTICHPEPPHEFLQLGGGFAIGLPDAETAIRALIGPPKLATVR